MAVAQIVCRGFGAGTTIALLVTVGYGGSALAPAPTVPVWCDARTVVMQASQRGAGAVHVQQASVLWPAEVRTSRVVTLGAGQGMDGYGDGFPNLTDVPDVPDVPAETLTVSGTTYRLIFFEPWSWAGTPLDGAPLSGTFTEDWA